MSKPKTHVALILDQSSSMLTRRAESAQNYNEYVQQMKEDSKDQDISVSLVTFNGQVFEHLWDVDAEKLAEATADDYICNGSTALRDAVGYTITKLLKSEDVNDENTAFLLYIISDGEENSSKHWKRPQLVYDNKNHRWEQNEEDELRKLIESIQETKRWTITYLGCTETQVQQAVQEYGLRAANTATFQNDTAGAAGIALKKARGSMKRYFANRDQGIVQADCMYNLNSNSCGKFDDSYDASLDAPVGGAGGVGDTIVGAKTVSSNNPNLIKPFQNISTPVSWSQ